MRLFGAFLLVFAAMLAVGCIQQTKYVCADRSIVDEASLCPLVQRYVCQNGTIVNSADRCTKEYICPDGSVVPDTDACKPKAGTPEGESMIYWDEEALPFQIEAYTIAKSTLFMTVKNAGNQTLKFKEMRFDGRPIRLGFTNTTFAPGQERVASGSMEISCGDSGKAFSYSIAIAYDNLDTEEEDKTQVGFKSLTGNCTTLPQVVLNSACTGATKEKSGTVRISNTGIGTVPQNSINVKVGSRIFMLEHAALGSGKSMNVTEMDLGTPLTSGTQVETWMTGGSTVLIVCMT